MDLLIMTGPIALTSMVAYLAAQRSLQLSRKQLGTAALRTVECLGAGLIFYVVNVVVGIAVILMARVLPNAFVSLYVLTDVTVAFFSLAQGLAFEWWRERSGTPTWRR